MIIGIGTDIVCLSRIKLLLEKHGSAFFERILTSREILEFHDRIDNLPYLAGRWAAKEAFSKAVGTGIGGAVNWKDCEILNNANGAPSINLYANAFNITERLNVKMSHVSISHDTEYATATVILEH